MYAWRFEANRELRWLQVADPEPGDGEVVIDVAAAGLCHTDVTHMSTGGSHLPFQPITLGHEVYGRIRTIGPEVNGWSVGDRVAVLATMAGPGSARDGGYAEQVIGRADELVAVPDEVSDEVAAVATDAGVTSYRAVLTQGRVRAGTRVGIIGLGGLGMLGARIAVVAGAHVFASDPKLSLHALALDQGVSQCAPTILDFADHDLDVVIDFVGLNTTRDALKAVRPSGRVVQVGIGNFEATIDLLDVLIKQPEYTGSATGETKDLDGVLNLMAKGEVAPIIETISFADIPSGLARLAEGKVTGRLVATREA